MEEKSIVGKKKVKEEKEEYRIGLEGIYGVHDHIPHNVHWPGESEVILQIRMLDDENLLAGHAKRGGRTQ